jgi:very-short-patch-repair endonuclease
MGTAERNKSVNESVHELIARQFGVITREDAARFGISPSAITRRTQSGEWTRVLPGVYRVTAAPVGLRQTTLAATRWAGDGALVSHATAAVLHGFGEVRSRKVELWLPYPRNLSSPLVTVHRGTRLDRADRATLDGIPITTPARTLIDIAERLENHRLSALMEDLIRRGLVAPDRLAARLDALRRSGRSGCGRLEALLDQRGDGRPLESALEALAWQLIVESGVQLPERQHWVSVTEGRYRLDFAWPDLMLGIECEGYAYHGDRARWGKDRARFAELGVVGWRVLPITWTSCTHERERVIRWITTAVAKHPRGFIDR